ncbi:uncharacterized protein LOC117341070 [Pecten maximus]|uniref:uncharacterized protein LOC117341070 n=1 Tax=Pecten maximus TaxID=6579 RepID=UPI0014586853|nr:uncharacterized protein LOC117341070 [Pecten maximus]
MACSPTLQGSQTSQRSLASDLQLDAHLTKSLCEICGATLLGDRRSCRVCNKVLCVCCSEMQEKLLFMRNDTKKSKGANCPLCDLLHNLNSGENSSPIDGKASIPYQNHDDIEHSSETETAGLPPVLDKVTVSKGADNPVSSGSSSSHIKRVDMTIIDSAKTNQENGQGDQQETRPNRVKIDEKSAMTQGHQQGTIFTKGQGHNQKTIKDNGQRDTVVKTHEEKLKTNLERGQNDKIGKMTKGQGDKGETMTKGQGDKGETMTKGQGDKDRTVTKGQGDKGKTTTEGQGDNKGTIAKGQDDKEWKVTKGQGDKGETMTKGQGDKGETMTKVQGDGVTKSLDRGENDKSEFTSITGQRSEKLEYETQMQVDPHTEVSVTNHNVLNQDDTGSERKETLGKSDTSLSREEKNSNDDKHVQNAANKFEIKHSQKGESVISSDKTESTTFKDDKMLEGKLKQHVQSLNKEISELGDSVSQSGSSRVLSEVSTVSQSESSRVLSEVSTVSQSESSRVLSEVSAADDSPYGMMNFMDDEDGLDDDLEEVEYDNLKLKEYSEQSGLLMDTLFGGLLGLGQSQQSNSRHHARKPGIKMAFLTMQKPGKITKQQDEFGRERVTQQYHYRNILIVPVDSVDRSSAKSPVSSVDTYTPQESISNLNKDPDDSNFQTFRLSNQSVQGSNPGASQASRFPTGLPEGYSSGEFSSILHSRDNCSSHRGVSPDKHNVGSSKARPGISDNFQSAGSDSFRGDTVVPLTPNSTDPELPDSGSTAGRRSNSSMATPKHVKKRNRQGFAHACSGCGRRDCEGNFMKLLREMIVTAGNAGFEIRNVIPDGNCMFAAIVDQLELKKDFTFSPKSIRFECLNYLRENPESEDGTPYALFLDAETWEEYLTRMSQDGEWGDHMMLQAVSQVTKKHIQVIHHDAERDWTVIEYKLTPLDKSDKSDCLFLGHVGEFHYVSLRPSDLAKQLHNKDDSDEEDFKSLDVFPSLQNLPSFEDPAKQEMFEENYFDPWSEIPVVHLSYILKKFVPITTTLQSADSMVTNVEIMTEEGQMSAIRKQYGISASSSVVLIGDAAQGLYAPYLNERERTEYDKGSEWVDVTGLVMPNMCIAYPKDHSDVGETNALIETKDTHPGYARLLTRYPSQWGMPASGPGTVTCYLPSHHSNFKKAFNMSKEQKDYSASQNPSLVSFFNEISMAIVAPFWPVAAAEWKTRQRKANWPPQKIIDNIISGGYHFECNPHPKSKNPDIEFHACFGVAEKMLAQEALSREQRYIFLVFKALCSQEFTEDELITSAHLKSIFFYACEQVPGDVWLSRPGSCIFYLLEALFVCIQDRNVPDYFLPANNLIDHFDEDQHKRILQKIMTLRNDPMTNLLKIGQKNHIYNAHRILCLVNSDIEVFHEHHSARRSVLEALVPISIDIAKYNIQTGAYKQALEQLQEAYEERLAISTCEDALPFTAFLTQATDGCFIEHQWWFFLNVDQQLHTTLCADLSMAMQPVALEELVGKDVAQNFVGTLIPAVMARKLCRFCSDMAVHLFQNYHTQKCLPFLLFNLDRYREKQQRLALVNNHGQQQYYENMQALTSEEEDDFTDENAVRVFNQLYIVYNRLNQLWIFQDLLPEFETLCEIVNTRSAFSKLVTILRQMGLTEKAQLAEARRNSIPRETAATCYLDHGNAYY